MLSTVRQGRFPHGHAVAAWPVGFFAGLSQISSRGLPGNGGRAFMYEQIAQSRLALALLAALLAAASAAFFMGRRKAVALAGADVRALHSRPNYHGYLVALWTLGPSLLVLLIYALAGTALADRLAATNAPATIAALPPFEQSVQVDAARALASGAGLVAPEGEMAGPVREL